MRAAARALLVAAALPWCLQAQASTDPARLKQLYHAHQIFELREAVEGHTVLGQANAVTIDLRAMLLTLR